MFHTTFNQADGSHCISIKFSLEFCFNISRKINSQLGPPHLRLNCAPVVQATATAVGTDAAVLPPHAAEEESSEALAQPLAEGLGVGDAAELRVAQLFLPAHAANECSELSKL